MLTPWGEYPHVVRRILSLALPFPGPRSPYLKTRGSRFRQKRLGPVWHLTTIMETFFFGVIPPAPPFSWHCSPRSGVGVGTELQWHSWSVIGMDVGLPPFPCCSPSPPSVKCAGSGFSGVEVWVVIAGSEVCPLSPCFSPLLHFFFLFSSWFHYPMQIIPRDL